MYMGKTAYMLSVLRSVYSVPGDKMIKFNYRSTK